MRRRARAAQDHVIQEPDLVVGTLWVWLLLLVAVVGRLAYADEYKLGVGDAVDVQVYGEPGLSKVATVSETCALELPLIGSVQACGLTTVQLGTAIRDALASNYLVDPNVLVGLQSQGGRTVEVKGQVGKPGVLGFEAGMTLSQAITLAGGPSTANVIQAKVTSQQGGEQVYYLPDLERSSLALQPGDVVTLMPPAFVYVVGEVVHEGPVAFSVGMTAGQAIALAQGPSQFASLSKVRVLRSDGTTVKVNIKKVNKGKASDVVLGPNDRVVVGQSVF